MRAHLFKNGFNRLKTVRAGDLWLALRITGMLTPLPILQRTLTLPALVRLYDAAPLPAAPLHHDPVRLARLTKRLLFYAQRRDYCFKQSLVLFHFLRKWGYPVRIFFGVTRKAGKLTGHAWVEVSDQPFAEKKDPRLTFRPVYAFPDHSIPNQGGIP